MLALGRLPGPARGLAVPVLGVLGVAGMAYAVFLGVSLVEPRETGA